MALANHFGSEIPRKTYVALCGYPPEDEFTVDAPLSVDRFRPGVMRVSRAGKRSRTDFRVRALHQLGVAGGQSAHRAHASDPGAPAACRIPILSDPVYGGTELFLSSLKPRYHRSADKTGVRSSRPSGFTPGNWNCPIRSQEKRCASGFVAPGV